MVAHNATRVAHNGNVVTHNPTGVEQNCTVMVGGAIVLAHNCQVVELKSPEEPESVPLKRSCGAAL